MSYVFQSEAKELRKLKKEVLTKLMCFVGRQVALEVAMGTELTMWGVLNRLADEGFTVIGESTSFVIDTGCGKLQLDATNWELEFEDSAFEDYFYMRSSHLEELMAKTHHFSQMEKLVADESATANL